MKLIYQREEEAPKAGTGDFVPVKLADGRTVIISGMRAAAANLSFSDEAAVRKLAQEIAFDAEHPAAR